MTKVFISGSRMISHLNGDVTDRLQNIISNGFEVLTGDANGVDKAIQRHFYEQSYDDVTIYHVGEEPRNNVGGWRSIAVEVRGKYRGRDLYTQKDRRMAEIADSGMIIWDGKSSGSVQNMIWMIENHKVSLVYQVSMRKFVKIRNRYDLSNLLAGIDEADRAEIDRKIAVNRYVTGQIKEYSQGSLEF
jgi:hypothetical protein